MVNVPAPEPFGRLADGRVVHRWWLDDGQLALAVLDLGATVQSLLVPLPGGGRRDVVLGFDDAAGYEQHPTMYCGAVVGRYANRIDRGRFTLDGVTHRLPVNDRGNTLHGGPGGFQTRSWKVEPLDPVTLRCSLTSPAGDQGFPGELRLEVRYRLLPGAVRIGYTATADAPTVVNPTQHAYFALGETGTGVYDHQLQVFADSCTPTRADGIPTGELARVDGTPLDLRRAARVGATVEALAATGVTGGLDHNLVVPGSELRPIAVLTAPGDAPRLEVRSTEPAVQVFSASGFDGRWRGKAGVPMPPGAGLCLETQHHPDAPNQPHFPSTRLDPGGTFSSVTEWRF